MKKTLKEAIMILLLIIFGITGMNAQILVNEDFENVTEMVPAGWEVAYGDDSYPFPLSSVEELGGLGLSCSGDKAFLTALESETLPFSFITSPSYTNANSSTTVVSFNFKVVDYSGFQPAIFDFGNINTFYSIDGGENWSELGTINNTNFNSTEVCSTINYVIPENTLSTTSDFKIKWEMNCSAGFIIIVIDDLSISQTNSLCYPPTNITTTNVGTLSASIEWESDEDAFELEYGSVGFNIGEGTNISVIDNAYLLSGLIPGNNYQYYIRTDCGNDDKSFWIGPFSFTTSCDSVELFTEDFENYDTGNMVPDCWRRILSGTGSQTIVSNSPTSSGNRQIRQQSSNYLNSTIVILPQVSNIDAQTHWLRFKARIDSGTGNLQVGYITDVTDPNTFVNITSLTIANTSYASNDSEYAVPFIGNIPSTARIAIRNPGTSNAQHFWDDVHWEVAPSCLPTFAPTATNISDSTVALAWQSSGDTFDIEYGPTGFVIGTGIMITEIGNPYILTGLTSGVDYDYYVRQKCGEEDGVSNWNGPVSFKPAIFEGNIPTLLNENPSVDDYSCAYEPISIIIPEGKQLMSLNLKYKMISASPAWTSQQRSVLYSSTLGIGEEFVVAGETNLPGISEHDRFVTFANGTTGTVEFELKAWRTQGGAGCDANSIYIMDGTWILTPEFEDIPSCPNPSTNLGYTNITEDSLDLVWTAEEGTFQVKWGNVDFNIESEGTTASGITTNSWSLSGLDSSVIYEFYVRRDCSTEDIEDYGAWVGPVKFNPGYCIPSVGIVHYFTQFYTTNAIDNIIITQTLDAGYVNSTSMIITEEAGDSFNFTSNYIGGASGLRIWIDWNNDFIFEDSEEVFYQVNDNGNKSGVITIPSDALPGNYRMRIRGQAETDSVPPSCGQTDYGQVIDFTLSILCGEVSPPIGSETQTFTSGSTLFDLSVEGNNLVWYADSNLTEVLEDVTLLVDETTYYVVNEQGNCQSEVLAVTVNEVLSTSDFSSFGFSYQPNPVNEVLYLRANAEISEVVVFNMLGQTLSLSVLSNNTQIDMTRLPSGNYILSVTIEGVNKTFKVIKQ